MSLTLYDAAVGTFQQLLPSVAGFMDKGLAHCREHGVDPAEFVETRLYPDMAPFRFQILSIVKHSRGAVEAVMTGEFSPPKSGSEDYATLQTMVADARAAMDNVRPDDINSRAASDVTFRLGERTIPFTAEGFLLSFSLPNFQFHATTAYDILRSKGVKLGKRDYLGQLRIKS